MLSILLWMVLKQYTVYMYHQCKLSAMSVHVGGGGGGGGLGTGLVNCELVLKWWHGVVG